jgi:hypothetical protein
MDVNWRYLHHLVVLTACVFLGAMVAVHFGQDANWDFFNYHYYNGYAILTGAWRQNIAPAQLQSYLNPTLDIATYFMYTHLPPIVVGALLGGFQGLAYWLVYEIAWVVFARYAVATRAMLAVGCAALAFYTPSNFAELGSSMGDVTVSVPVLAGILLLLYSIRARTHALLLVAAAGLLLGLAVGAKLTVVAFVIPVYLMVGITVTSSWLKRAVILSGSLALGAVAVMGYWMIDLYRTVGNPLFPYYNNLFKSPYALPVSASDARFFPHTLHQWVLLPFYFTETTTLQVQELPFQDLAFAIAYVLLVIAIGVGLAMLVVRLLASARAGLPGWAHDPQMWISQQWRLAARKLSSEDLNALRITATVILGWVLWERVFSIYRYTVTLDFLVPIVIGVLVGWIVRSRTLQLGVTLLLFAVAAAAMIPTDWGRTPWASAPFSVAVPTLPDPQHSVIVIVSNNPMSYLIPEFPGQVRFVSFDTNLASVITPRYTDKELAVIASTTGPVYFVTDAASYTSAATDFHAITGLTVNQKSCAPIKGAMTPTLFCQTSG